MREYKVHTIESAPEKSKPALLGLKQNVGLVPNLAATMAESPTLVNGFVGAFGNFHSGTFNGAEKQVLLLTNAVTNRCAWAVAFHSTMALKEGVASAVVQAIRDERLPDDRKFAALSGYTKALIDQRGHLSDSQFENFRAAGYTAAQAFEVIAGLAVSTMANYAGNLANPPLEAPIAAQAWHAN
jgi:AhpD family alkylhydroperoxidase